LLHHIFSLPNGLAYPCTLQGRRRGWHEGGCQRRARLLPLGRRQESGSSH
jgi:hypothetical protein